jgi:hypothetical protein
MRKRREKDRIGRNESRKYKGRKKEMMRHRKSREGKRKELQCSLL